jgi:hypothetical protein
MTAARSACPTRAGIIHATPKRRAECGSAGETKALAQAELSSTELFSVLHPTEGSIELKALIGETVLSLIRVEEDPGGHRDDGEKQPSEELLSKFMGNGLIDGASPMVPTHERGPAGRQRSIRFHEQGVMVEAAIDDAIAGDDYASSTEQPPA